MSVNKHKMIKNEYLHRLKRKTNWVAKDETLLIDGLPRDARASKVFKANELNKIVNPKQDSLKQAIPNLSWCFNIPIGKFLVDALNDKHKIAIYFELYNSHRAERWRKEASRYLTARGYKVFFGESFDAIQKHVNSPAISVVEALARLKRS